MLVTNYLHQAMVYVLPHIIEFDDFYSSIGNYINREPNEIRTSLISHYKSLATDITFLRRTYDDNFQERFALDLKSLEVNT